MVGRCKYTGGQSCSGDNYKHPVDTLKWENRNKISQPQLDFTIELVDDSGGFNNMVGRCKYTGGQSCSGDNHKHPVDILKWEKRKKNYTGGQYCSGDNYEFCSSTTGCKVRLCPFLLDNLQY